jgi:acetyl-CoA synthetase
MRCPNCQNDDLSPAPSRQLVDGLPGGGGLNIAHEAVDRHATGGLGDKVG